MKAKFIYEEFKENSDPIDDMGIGTRGYSAYSEVWVICNDDIGDIEEIFLSKEKAQKVAERMNKEIYKNSRKINSSYTDEEFKKYANSKEFKRRYIKVMSLSDAIYKIRDNVRYESDYY